MFEYLNLLLTDFTIQTITLGTAIIGLTCGILGSFAVLRKQSLLGDAIAHSALPGIAIAFILTGVKDTLLFIIGASLSGIIGAIWINSITKNTRLKSDSALGIILSVFFGFGIVLLTIIQRKPNANQAGLERFLFGQAATLVPSDVIVIGIIGILSLILIIIFWKEFKILTFDPQFAKTLGYNIHLLDLLLTSFIVVAIVLGLQAVGVVLMSALLLAPAAAARQWSNKLGTMIIISAIFGALSGIIGTAISSTNLRLSTGPIIVLIAVTLVLLSFVFSPSRGLLSRQLRYIKNRKSMRLNKTLQQMLEIVDSHEDFSHPHSIKLLNDLQGFRKKCLKELENLGLIKIQLNNWSLTEEGYKKAKSI
ncbi:MAG: metal ABC transporter permease [Candidatus Kapabacteria bacterium]|nr:metal ABC transporter permease [Candidatus Kapabacteria bacterium]